MATTRLVIDKQAVEQVINDPTARSIVDDAANEFSAVAREYAPHRTGAGAASIGADSDPNAAEADVSWDEDHRYMRFSEFGTKYMPARPFLASALDRYAEF